MRPHPCPSSPNRSDPPTVPWGPLPGILRRAIRLVRAGSPFADRGKDAHGAEPGGPVRAGGGRGAGRDGHGVGRASPHLPRPRPSRRPTRPSPGRCRRRCRGAGGGPAGQRDRVHRGHAGLLQDPGRTRQRQLPLRHPRTRVPLHRRRTRGSGLPPALRGGRHRRARLVDRAPCRHRGGRRLATRWRRRRVRGRAGRIGVGPGLPRPVGRRPVLRLHGRHHGHAQGRGVAARRHLLRGHGWWRSVRLG